jgi:succinate dehydrogenase flavin-adding protein (antitoxin of CptAB toxin-antitoxin module)
MGNNLGICTGRFDYNQFDLFLNFVKKDRMTVKEVVNSKLFGYIVSITTSVIMVFFVESVTGRRESEKSIRSQFSERPTSEQVNLKFAEVKSYIDKQDENIMKLLLQHIEESDKQNEVMMNYVVSIDRKIDILITLNKK